jgi:hypothetical protein
MAHNLKHPDYYDDDFLIKQIAKESPLFNSYIQAALKETDSEYPTNQIWLGTLQLGKDKVATQINLTVTQEGKHFIDENG